MPEPIVTLNEGGLVSDLRELIGKTVEDTLNGLLEAEADELVGAERHGRTAERGGAYRAGYCDRGPTTSSRATAALRRRIAAPGPASGRRRRSAAATSSSKTC